MSVCPYCAGTGRLSDDRLVNVTQAMQLAGVSRRTIYYWIQAGKVESLLTAGHQLRIRVSSLRLREKAGAA